VSPDNSPCRPNETTGEFFEHAIVNSLAPLSVKADRDELGMPASYATIRGQVRRQRIQRWT
jgi:hypothetical protein